MVYINSWGMLQQIVIYVLSFKYYMLKSRGSLLVIIADIILRDMCKSEDNFSINSDIFSSSQTVLG